MGVCLMVTNRSVPVDTVLPHISYRDVAAASGWLTATFGFAEHYRGRVQSVVRATGTGPLEPRTSRRGGIS
jgi:hypothetical protein